MCTHVNFTRVNEIETYGRLRVYVIQGFHFIYERKFYTLNYARKNYATLEINPNEAEGLNA